VSILVLYPCTNPLTIPPAEQPTLQIPQRADKTSATARTISAEANVRGGAQEGKNMQEQEWADEARREGTPSMMLAAVGKAAGAAAGGYAGATTGLSHCVVFSI
jgi:hypothetical protein